MEAQLFWLPVQEVYKQDKHSQNSAKDKQTYNNNSKFVFVFFKDGYNVEILHAAGGNLLRWSDHTAAGTADTPEPPGRQKTPGRSFHLMEDEPEVRVHCVHVSEGQNRIKQNGMLLFVPHWVYFHNYSNKKKQQHRT